MADNSSVNSEGNEFEEEEAEQGEEDNPLFSVKEGETFFTKDEESELLFGDFYLEFKGQIYNNDETYWVCSCGAKVSGNLEERTIVIPHSAFETKKKFQQLTTKSFGGGTFSFSKQGNLHSYYLYLKKQYHNHCSKENKAEDYFAAETIGPQRNEQDYWCLSKKVHLYKGKILQKENHRFFFLDDSCKPYEVSISKRLIENRKELSHVCKKFIEASSAFKHNSDSFKLATAFVLHRLLNVHNEESWSMSSAALLHSELEQRNVGKSFTMDLLVRAEGAASRRHPSMLSGGDQNQSGASPKLITKTLSKFSLVAMVDDPVIGQNFNELLVQTQSGLTSGSCSSGTVTTTGSLLISSNTNVNIRAEGRVLVFKYSKGEFSDEDEEKLMELKNCTYANTGFLLAWAITQKNIWEELFPKVCPSVEKALHTYLPDMQTRWRKGMAAVISTGAIFHGSVGVPPCLEDTINKVVSQNKVKTDKDIILRLQQSIIEKLETDHTNALYWLNPKVKVRCDGSEHSAIGIRSTVLEAFQQVPTKEITAKLKNITDQQKTISMYFAKDKSSACTLEDVTIRKPGKAQQVKGWKIPKSCFDDNFFDYITDCCDNKQRRKFSQSTESTEEDAMEEHQLLAELASTFQPLNRQIIEDCQDRNSQERDEEDNFSKMLTPNSKTEWRQCTPEQRIVFKKGFSAGKRSSLSQLRTGSDSLNDDHGSTPSTSGDNEDNFINVENNVTSSSEDDGADMGGPSTVQNDIPDRKKSRKRKGEIQKLSEGFHWYSKTNETSRKRPH